MARDVVTVQTNAPFRKVARMLAEHHVSGLPVLDADGRVVGIVSEADLLARQARAGGTDGAWMWHLLRDKTFTRRGVSLTAADLMSSPAVTVGANDRLASAAATLARHGVKRAPVLDADGVLRGIVSRRDLLSVYLRHDADLATEIREQVLTRALSVAPMNVRVQVHGGVVTLRGKVVRQSMIEVITSLTETVDGVIDVRNEIVAETDDTHRPPTSPEALTMTHPRTGH